MMTTKPPPNGRGCGDRSEESAYACCGFDNHGTGTPIEFFVVDPAIPWPGKFQRGVKILPRNLRDSTSVNDLVIFVGKKFYESPWDFVEEARRFGASRKLPNNLPFDQLTPGESRMVFVHSKAVPEFDYESDQERPYYGCSCFWSDDGNYDQDAWRSAIPGWHYPEIKPCTHALRDLAFLVHGDIELLSDDYGDGFYQVNMPSFSYEARCPAHPEELFTDKWGVGIFMALPLTHIEYCKRSDDKSKANAEAAGFQTMVMEY